MTKTSRRRRVLVWVGVITVVMVASLLVGGAIGRNVNRGSAVPTQSTPPSPAPSSAPTGVPSTGIPTRGGHPLPLSNVMVGEGGTDEIHGMPIGYPKTMAGAAQAMINYENAFVSPAILIPEQSEAIQNYIFSDPERRDALGWRERTSEQIREALRLNEDAAPVTKDGKPDHSRKLYYAAYPEYGAFRVLDAEPNLTSAAPDEVHIQLWRPTVGGCVKPGTREGVSVKFGIVDYTLRWFSGDWHITGNNIDIDASEVQPQDSSSPIVPFKERARLLPAADGWMLPGNAAEKPVDRLEFPVELG